jgi:tRNA (guanine37-N1)-methyltransferase
MREPKPIADRQRLSDLLGKNLNTEELKFVPSSFDVVGDILIFADFPLQLEKKEKFIGECFLRTYKNLKVVCKKVRKYSGKFRTPVLKIIAGEKRKETLHRENKCLIKLDVEACYFSARLANERKRIASLVKPKEKVLVMFSGAGPFPLVIAKNSEASLIYGVEKNPVAHRYAQENLKLNKIANIRLFMGDVKSVLPRTRIKFDRVLMPLPKGAGTFLSIALPKLRKKGILHFYDFLNEDEFKRAGEKLAMACKKARRKPEILDVVKCGQYSPHVYRICVDAMIT